MFFLHKGLGSPAKHSLGLSTPLWGLPSFCLHPLRGQMQGFLGWGVTMPQFENLCYNSSNLNLTHAVAVYSQQDFPWDQRPEVTLPSMSWFCSKLWSPTVLCSKTKLSHGYGNLSYYAVALQFGLSWANAFSWSILFTIGLKATSGANFIMYVLFTFFYVIRSDLTAIKRSSCTGETGSWSSLRMIISLNLSRCIILANLWYLVQ